MPVILALRGLRISIRGQTGMHSSTVSKKEGRREGGGGGKET
jgi:hypothetical protein